MKQNYSISKYIIKHELDIEKMIKNFKGYIYTIIENNSHGKLTYEDKEEIMSDVFLTVWHNKDKIDNNRPLKNYMAGITKNLIRNKFKNKKHSNSEVSLEDNEIQDLSNIDIICEQRQAIEVISKELNNMEQDEYQIFSKYYYFSKSIKEIAKELGLSESNVKVKLHRIRKKLKKELQTKGFLYKALSIILVLCMITGVVYASVNIINKMQEKTEGKEEREIPEGATQFKYASLYIENIEEFDRLNINYDEEQDIYYTDTLNINNYIKLAQKLKIITKNVITEDDLREAKDIILVFKKTDNKLELRRMKSIQNEPEKIGIVIKETEEKYGNGITGELIIIKSNPRKGYKFYME